MSKSIDEYRKLIRKESRLYASLTDAFRPALHSAMTDYLLKARRWNSVEDTEERLQILGSIHDSVIVLLIENPSSPILHTLHTRLHEMANLVSPDDLAEFAEDFDMWASELQEPK